MLKMLYFQFVSVAIYICIHAEDGNLKWTIQIILLKQKSSLKNKPYSPYLTT